jgi:transposase-like protein
VVAISSNSLKSGKDYPGNWTQFLQWFPDDNACLQFLEHLRWPSGFVCPRCLKLSKPYHLSRGRMMCPICRYQGTVTADTLFEKSRTPLTNWFAAAWYITNEKHGVSALGLQRLLGLGSYQTAWTMLHRYRRAMVNPSRGKLSGFVEVDETYVGGTDKAKTRAPCAQSKKSIVAIAVEIKKPKGFGRIRLKRIEAATQVQLHSFIQETIEPSSVVQTDGSSAYHRIHELGYVRNKLVQLGSKEPAHETLVGVHRVASLLKRWILGTHQGSVGHEHLDSYLDEYAFRFNRRASNSRGLLFYRLLEQAVVTPPVSYENIKKR